MKKNIIKFLILCVFVSNLKINSIKSVTDDTKLGLEVGIPVGTTATLIIVAVAMYIKMYLGGTAHTPEDFAVVQSNIVQKMVEKDQRPNVKKTLKVVDDNFKMGKKPEEVTAEAAATLTKSGTPVTTVQLTEAVGLVPIIKAATPSADIADMARESISKLGTMIIKSPSSQRASEISTVEKSSVSSESEGNIAALKSISAKDAPKGPLVSYKMAPAVVTGRIKMAIRQKMRAFIVKKQKENEQEKDENKRKENEKEIKKLQEKYSEYILTKADYFSDIENSMKDKADGKIEESIKKAAKFITTFINDFNLTNTKGKAEAFSILSDLMDEFLIKENNLDIIFVKELSNSLGQEVSETLGFLAGRGVNQQRLVEINNEIVKETFTKPHIDISEKLKFETPLDFSDALTAMKSQKSMKDINALEHEGSVFLITKDPHTGISILEKQISGSAIDPNLKIARYEPTIKQFQRVNEPALIK